MMLIRGSTSDQPKDARNGPISQSDCWTPGTEECTEERDNDDENKLAPGEEHGHLDWHVEIKLEQHGIANSDTYEHAKDARAEHHNEGLIEVKHAYAVFSETHGS